jgi:exonuclease SbcC
MRILSLRFKNLNSLKGEFKIDFTDPELSKSGLFAITGPTGAGKSTILDAITLSLYAYIPRFKDVTATTVSEQNAVVTRRTSEAYSELTFEVGGQAYRTNWAIRKARTGNWQQPSFSLSKKNMSGDFEVMTDSIRSTKEKVPEIVGLSSDQFTQAIVLSQGRFDEFLKANKDDRYALLEIITGSDIFRRIGRKAYEKGSEVKRNIDLLKAEMVGLNPMNDADLALKRQELEDLQSKAKGLGLEVDTWNKKSENRTKVLEKRRQMADAERELSCLTAEIHAFHSEDHRLFRHEKAQSFQEDWNMIQLLSSQLDDKRKQEGSFAETIGRSEADQSDLIRQLSAKTGDPVDPDRFSTVLSRFHRKVKDLDEEVQALQRRIAEERGKAKTNMDVLPDRIKDELRSIGADAERMGRYISDRDAQMDATPLPDWMDAVRIDESLDLLKKDIERLKDALRIAGEIGNSGKRHQEFENSLAESQKGRDGIQADVDRFKTEVGELKISLDALDSEIERYRAVNALEAYRQQLVDGQPCPCCGSTVHPYSSGYASENTDIHARYLRKKEEYVEAQSKLNKREIELCSLEAKMDLTGQNLLKERKHIDAEKARYADCLSQIRLIPRTSLDRPKECLDEVMLVEANALSLQEWRRFRDPLSAYAESMSQVPGLEMSLKGKKESRSQMFVEKDVDGYKDAMNTRWTATDSVLVQTRKLLENVRSEIINIESDRKAAIEALLPRIQESGFTHLDDYRNALLPDPVYKDLSKRKKDLQSRKDGLDAKFAILSGELREADALDDPSVEDAELMERLEEAKSKLAATQQQTGSVRNELETDEFIRQKSNAVRDKLQAEESISRLYDILNSYIGDKDGDKFNRIVQRLTIQHLFGLANRRMTQLMDRYRIELVEGKDDIWITDLYMGGEKRSIESASGGERFVISLALALSLSEMASMNVRIDSMFIDEGFGSLSPDELYQAIDMLERLQVESEKTVGIISHVDSLKERINTQIVAKKLYEGESTLYLKVMDSQKSLKISA